MRILADPTEFEGAFAVGNEFDRDVVREGFPYRLSINDSSRRPGDRLSCGIVWFNEEERLQLIEQLQSLGSKDGQA